MCELRFVELPEQEEDVRLWINAALIIDVEEDSTGVHVVTNVSMVNGDSYELAGVTAKQVWKKVRDAAWI